MSLQYLLCESPVTAECICHRGSDWVPSQPDLRLPLSAATVNVCQHSKIMSIPLGVLGMHAQEEQQEEREGLGTIHSTWKRL